jgi:hypothetical protein
VHAIACCNLAEIAAGVTTEVSVPAGHRWIPTGMTARYPARARTDLRAVAVVADLSAMAVDESRDVVVPVEITDTDTAGRRARRHHHARLPPHLREVTAGGTTAHPRS